MFRFLKITCEQANAICNKAQYGEASFIEKIQLNWHLMVCKICTSYTKQNKTLTKICKQKAAEEKNNLVNLTEQEKELLKKTIKRKMLQ